MSASKGRHVFAWYYCEPSGQACQRQKEAMSSPGTAVNLHEILKAIQQGPSHLGMEASPLITYQTRQRGSLNFKSPRFKFNHPINKRGMEVNYQVSKLTAQGLPGKKVTYFCVHLHGVPGPSSGTVGALLPARAAAPWRGALRASRASTAGVRGDSFHGGGMESPGKTDTCVKSHPPPPSVGRDTHIIGVGVIKLHQLLLDQREVRQSLEEQGGRTTHSRALQS